MTKKDHCALLYGMAGAAVVALAVCAIVLKTRRQNPVGHAERLFNRALATISNIQQELKDFHSTLPSVLPSAAEDGA
ncbi:MAG: hypothetical protein ACUVTZ_00790 [Armatimonadota bacterium]